MNINRNNIKNDYIMSICKFLYIYYHVEGDQLYKLTHTQIKDMFGINNLSNSKVLIEDILKGETILVRDSEGIVLGYNNPYVYEENISDSTTPNINFDNSKNNLNININDIDKYSDYELEELIKNCKKTNNDKVKNYIIKELHKRSNKELSKEKILNKVKKRELKKE